MICKHKNTRHLECEEHGSLCWLIICCDCGADVGQDKELKKEWERLHPEKVKP